MRKRKVAERIDLRDILGSGALISIGIYVTTYSWRFLAFGTISNMGPGMFPAALGFILSGVGVAILLFTLLRQTYRSDKNLPDIDLRSFLAILTSILAFALVLPSFGLVPAVVALTLIVSRADSKLSPLGTTFLAVGLSIGVVLIFQVGLGVPVATMAWPW